MHWLLFTHKILFSSTCFERQVLIFRRIQMYTCSIWYCHSLWEFLVTCRYISVHCTVDSLSSNMLSNDKLRGWHWQNQILLTEKLQIFNPSRWTVDIRAGLFTSKLCRAQSPICGCRSFVNKCNLMRYTLSFGPLYILTWSKAVLKEMAAQYGEKYNEMCSCYEFVNNRVGRHLTSAFKLCSTPARVNHFSPLCSWHGTYQPSN